MYTALIVYAVLTGQQPEWLFFENSRYKTEADCGKFIKAYPAYLRAYHDGKVFIASRMCVKNADVVVEPGKPA